MDVCTILERFGHELHGCPDHAAEARLLLQAIHDATGADAAFLNPGSARVAVEVVGGKPLAAAWCHDLTRRALAEAGPGDEVLWANWWESPLCQVGDPSGMALVRLSKSRGAWVAALRFPPDPAFEPGCLRPMTLARRIFLNHHKYSRAQEGLKDTLFGLIQCLTEALEAKDPYTCGHSERVARIAARLGGEMGLAPDTVGNVYLAGLLHDIGKIGIRDGVLLKPGRLTEEEMAHVREHTVIGDRLVARIRQLEHLRPGVRNHHERYDGQGYPDGLAGEAIPLMARVLAVADACDALMADRPYRPALPPAAIDGILREGAGKQWDPDVITHFMACRHDLYPICQRGIGESAFRAVTTTVNAAVNEASREQGLPELDMAAG
jgi:hypothetical protein